jgi:hypothetical protein
MAWRDHIHPTSTNIAALAGGQPVTTAPPVVDDLVWGVIGAYGSLTQEQQKLFRFHTWLVRSDLLDAERDKLRTLLDAAIARAEAAERERD